jgi:hypothetical protein
VHVPSAENDSNALSAPFDETSLPTVQKSSGASTTDPMKKQFIARL